MRISTLGHGNPIDAPDSTFPVAQRSRILRVGPASVQQGVTPHLGGVLRTEHPAVTQPEKASDLTSSRALPRGTTTSYDEVIRTSPW